MPDDRSLLLDVAQAARLIVQFKSGMDYEAFRADARTQSAMIHQFLIIGEAAKSLSDDFKSRHGIVPWAAIARMRDKLIHHYRAVNLKEVWNAAESDIPKLLSFVEPLLPPEESR